MVKKLSTGPKDSHRMREESRTQRSSKRETQKQSTQPKSQSWRIKQLNWINYLSLIDQWQGRKSNGTHPNRKKN